MAELLPSDELVEEPSDYGALAPGTRLGRYELLVPVARGGMARVWAARLNGQRGFQKLVALKTILPHLAREKQFERMFLDEARIASGVHHPNVCEIYELGEENHTLYLAMEWVSGESLARLLRSTGNAEALDPRVVARVVADACAGAHAAHELTDDDGRQLGVVHRDLSPHNILLTADGVAKVADFGVAKALGQLHDATSAGQLKGKLAYMAPEQITGGAVDRRSDVFSLGCVLYEATTGHRPFRGDGDHQVMHAVLKGEFPPPSSIIRGYPPELERIVQRALSPQAILRYPTAERMRFALEEFLARGSLVTQSNVAQLLRARLGPVLERRRERIRQASTVGDRERGWSEPPGAMTPSGDPAHRSGVKQAQPRPMFTTMQLEGGAFAPGQPPQERPALDAPTVRETARPPTGLGGPGVAIPGAPGVPQGMGQYPPHGPSPSHPDRSYPGAAPAPGHVPPPYAGAPYPQQQTLPPPAMGSHASMHGYGGQPYAMTPSHGGMPAAPHSHAQSFGPSPPQSVAIDERASRPPATTGQYAVAIVVGVLAAALIAGGGFYAWQRRHADAKTEPAATPSAAASAAPSSAPSSAPAAKTELVFETTPADATLVVDGRELPPGTRQIPRPPAGTTVTLVVRAPGKRDATRLVDYFTVSPMSVVLEDAAPPVIEVGGEEPPAADPTAKPRDPVPAASQAHTAAPPATTTTPAVTTQPPPQGGQGAQPPPQGSRPPKPAKDPSLPANPY